MVTERRKVKEEEIKEQGRKKKLRLNLKTEWISGYSRVQAKWWKRRNITDPEAN